MKNPPKILLVIILITISTFCFSQKEKQDNFLPNFKHNIGIQFNPFLDGDLFRNYTQQYVIAIRYGLKHPSGFSFGPELSGSYVHHPVSNSYSINYGIFCRYTFLRRKKVSPFIEASGYFQTNRTKITDETHIIDGQNIFKNHKLSYYMSPGVTIYILKNIVSFDFLLKFSTDKFVNGKNFVPSFRINYHF